MILPRAVSISLLLAVAILGSGCARRFVMTTTNGTKIASRGKPKLVESKYVYNDGSGRKAEIPAMRVRLIEPYSSRSDPAKQLRQPELQ